VRAVTPRARQLTAAEGLDNVRYELGDAQVHRFGPAGFDVVISRFGAMFFTARRRRSSTSTPGVHR